MWFGRFGCLKLEGMDSGPPSFRKWISCPRGWLMINIDGPVGLLVVWPVVFLQFWDKRVGYLHWLISTKPNKVKPPWSFPNGVTDQTVSCVITNKFLYFKSWACRKNPGTAWVNPWCLHFDFNSGNVWGRKIHVNPFWKSTNKKFKDDVWQTNVHQTAKTKKRSDSGSRIHFPTSHIFP